MNARKIFDQFRRARQDGMAITGTWDITITRADGTVEHRRKTNQLTAAGLNVIASRMVSETGSAFGFLAVGSGTAAASLGSTLLINEISRKAGATLTSSKEVAIIVCTWGGAADSVTSAVLEEAGWFNNVNSGQATMLNKVLGVNATLADSDHLKLQVEVQVGSHNI